MKISRSLTLVGSLLAFSSMCLGPLLSAAEPDEDVETSRAAAKAPVTECTESVIAVPPDGPAEVAIRHALTKRVTIRCAEKPLADVIGQLSKEWKIPILLDQVALNDVGVNSDTPITLDVTGISARSALGFLLKPLDLTWMIYNEVLWITTPEECGCRLIIKVYNITDLVTDDDKLRDEVGGDDGQSLTQLITKAVNPNGWDEVGGPGYIALYRRGKVRALVVSQDEVAHEEIAALLNDLRAVCRAEAAKE